MTHIGAANLETASIKTRPQPAMAEGIKINLVKASILGLNLKTAVALGYIQRAIRKQLVPCSTIDGVSWWHVSPEWLNFVDTGHHFAPSLWDAQCLLNSLERAHLLESAELRHSPTACRVYRLKTTVLVEYTPVVRND
jgi:hypothetical protein